METPEAFVLTQHQPNTRLARGDRLTIVSADGDVIWDSCIVKKAEAGHVYLSKPGRIVELEPGVLWSDGHAEIVPVGTGYSIHHIKTGHTDTHIHPTVDSARATYERTKPAKVA